MDIRINEETRGRKKHRESGRINGKCKFSAADERVNRGKKRWGKQGEERGRILRIRKSYRKKGRASSQRP